MKQSSIEVLRGHVESQMTATQSRGGRSRTPAGALSP